MGTGGECPLTCFCAILQDYYPRIHGERRCCLCRTHSRRRKKVCVLARRHGAALQPWQARACVPLPSGSSVQLALPALQDRPAALFVVHARCEPLTCAAAAVRERAGEGEG